MIEQNESFFDLLFRDESPDEGYSLLGIALLASLAFHLLFVTCVKIRTFTVDEIPVTNLPALVTIDTSYGSILVSQEYDERENNRLSPAWFGYSAEILDDQVPLPRLDSALFQNVHALMLKNDLNDQNFVCEPTKGSLFTSAPRIPTAFPLRIICEGDLKTISLIEDGSDLFTRTYLEGLFASAPLAKTSNSCSFEAIVDGIDGSINSAQPLKTCADDRIQNFANILLKKLRFAPSLSKENFKGTIIFEFTCSGDILNLLTRQMYD